MHVKKQDIFYGHEHSREILNADLVKIASYDNTKIALNCRRSFDRFVADQLALVLVPHRPID